MFLNCFTHNLTPRIFSIGLLALSLWMGVPTYAQTFSEMTDEQMWEFATSENTEDAYRLYTLKFKEDGKWYDEAIDRIAKLRDEAQWAAAKAADTPAAYKRYLDIEPYGKYAKEAKRILGISTKSPSRDNTRPSSSGNNRPREETSNPPAVNPTPDNAPANPVTPPIVVPNAPRGEVSQNEEELWQRTTQIASVEGYQYFLDKYSQGTYAEEAVRRVPIKIIDNSVSGLPNEKNISVKYAVAPLVLEQIEGLETGNSSGPLSPVEQGDGSMTYDWPEGKVKLVVTPLNLTTHHVLLQTDTDENLVLHFRDQIDSTSVYGLQGGEASGTENVSQPRVSVSTGGVVELMGMKGASNSQDTLWFRIQGGTPPYYVRFSRSEQGGGQDYNHEEELNEGREAGMWYVEKQFLSERRKLSGTYFCYLTDENRSEHTKAPEPVQLAGGLLGNIPMWAMALPVVLILGVIGVLWILKKRNQRRQEDYF